MDRTMFYLILLLKIGSGSCGEYCFTGVDLEFCYYGCCGDGPIKVCCNITPMAIAGVVIGAIMMLASLVCCGFCIYYMCKKRENNIRPVQPTQTTNSIYVHNSPYGHPPPGAPPNYKQYNSYPSSLSQPPPYSDPAYPPGTVNNDHPQPAFKF